MNNHCVKCGILFEVSDEKLRYPHSIDCLLCEPCLKIWHRFFADNHAELILKYPKVCNPTWDVWIGNLGKERVEFT